MSQFRDLMEHKITLNGNKFLAIVNDLQNALFFDQNIKERKNRSSDLKWIVNDQILPSHFEELKEDEIS